MLLLAPHADDEVIGPGGVALLHRDLGDPVHVVILTDGAQGGDDPAAVLRERRRQESRAAAELLGAESIEFCGFPDGTRAREEDLGVVVPTLAALLDRLKPDVVYAPHPDETHADHHVTALALERALQSTRARPQCFGYEIWAALTPDVVVDVSEVFERKLELARCFPSQLGHTEILHFFGGLNAYRAVFLPKGARYGEAFCHLRPRSAE